jgi:apolipoprotein N-acyltransferase
VNRGDGSATSAAIATRRSAHMLDAVARRGGWVALLAGLALAAAFAPADLVVLSIVCPALLILLWQDATPREAAWRGGLFTGGTFLAGTYWLYHSVHEIGHAPLPVAILLMLGLVAIMGVYSAALGWLVARHAPRQGVARWMLLVPAGLILVEWLRGWLLSGFPWLSLGYAHLDSPLRGYAPVLGVYGVGLAAAVSAGAIVALILGHRAARIVAVVALVLIWGAGAWLTRIEWTEPRDSALDVALVQGAVPQTMKWESGQRERTERLYLGLSRPHFGADLVVWPEASIPALAADLGDFLTAVRSEAAAGGTALIMGLLRNEPATDAYYNAIVAWNPEQPAVEQWYAKRRLVPFGEFFPVPATVRSWLKLMSLPYSDFERGSDRQQPLAVAGERFAPTICYEDAYGTDQRRIVRESTVLVNVSNDAWFGDSTAPHQHLDISRMRAIEAARPTLRATNDGITVLIGHDGRVLDALPQFQPGVLTGSITPRTGLTPYLRLGNLPVLVLALAAIASGLLVRRRTATATSP